MAGWCDAAILEADRRWQEWVGSEAVYARQAERLSRQVLAGARVPPPVMNRTYR